MKETRGDEIFCFLKRPPNCSLNTLKTFPAGFFYTCGVNLRAKLRLYTHGRSETTKKEEEGGPTQQLKIGVVQMII
jgi:hypothetical protein